MTPSDQLPNNDNDTSTEKRASKAVELSLLLSSILAWIGVSISFLLILSHDFGGTLFCQNRTGCDAILSSRYSMLAGIPLPWLGITFYLFVLALLLVAYGIGSGTAFVMLLDLIKWLTVAGVSFSVSLMLIQFVILRGFCPLCTSSAIVATGLFFLAGKSRRLADKSSYQGSRWGAMALAGFVLVSGAVVTASSTAYRSRLQEALARPIQIDLSTARVNGPESAKVQLVVFSDFQCPICARLAPVLKRIRDEFPNDVKVAYRYFPIEGHDRAVPAAVAAECASEQGAFWDYHDQLFADPGNLSADRFLSIAAALGLDRDRFRACLNSEKARQVVEASYKDAAEMGLPGVPMIFLNGRMIRGLPDHDALVKEITQRLHPSP